MWWKQAQCPVICVTNRHLIKENQYLKQIETICRSNPAAIVLREKDLSQWEYEKLAESVKGLTDAYGIPCIYHNFHTVAAKLQGKRLHMPLGKISEMSREERAGFEKIGTSVHSLEELYYAQELGVSYVFAGHIFATDCKKGVPPRGVEFLRKICENSRVPVYAIGGIQKENQIQCIEAGAAGICVMSACMQTESDI